MGDVSVVTVRPDFSQGIHLEYSGSLDSKQNFQLGNRSTLSPCPASLESSLAKAFLGKCFPSRSRPKAFGEEETIPRKPVHPQLQPCFRGPRTHPTTHSRPAVTAHSKGGNTVSENFKTNLLSPKSSLLPVAKGVFWRFLTIPGWVLQLIELTCTYKEKSG